MASTKVIASLLIEMGMDTKDAEKSAKRMAKAVDGVGDAADRAGDQLDDAAKSAKRMKTALDGVGKATDMLGNLMLGVGAAVAGVGAAVLKTGGEFETLKVQLKTATGSAEAAEEAFSFIRGFTKETPFQLGEVTDAFVKLKNFGIEPTTKNLTAFGDFASAMGKDLDQVIEAVLDATTGEFERLKEFGIRASQQGDKVALTFKGITTTVGKNSKEISGFLTGIAEQNFGGAMAEQMTTLGGNISNLMDQFSEFFNSIAQMGPLQEFKLLLQDLSGIAGDKEGGLARTIARTLTKAIKGLRRLLTGDFVRAFEKVARAVEFLVQNFDKLIALFVAGKVITGVAALSTAFSGLGLSIAALTGPIGIAVAALVGLGITAVAVHNKIRAIPKIGPDRLEADFAAGADPGTIRELKSLRRKRDSATGIAAREAFDEKILALQERARRESMENSEERFQTTQARKFKLQEDQAAVESLLGINAVTSPDAAAVEVIQQNLSEGGDVQSAFSAVQQSRAGVPGAPKAKGKKGKRKGGSKKAKGKPAITSPTTLSELFRASAEGTIGPVASSTPAVADIEPTVAVDITNNNFTFTDTFNITGKGDAKAIGEQVIVVLKRELDRRNTRAGQQMAGNVVG